MPRNPGTTSHIPLLVLVLCLTAAVSAKRNKIRKTTHPTPEPTDPSNELGCSILDGMNKATTPQPVECCQHVASCEPENIITTATYPSFKMCLFPDAKGDMVSLHTRRMKAWEQYSTTILIKILQTASVNKKRGVVLDVGAYLGYYALVAASNGFPVIAFEPLKPQRERFLASIKLNGFEDLITVYPYAASDHATESVEMWSAVDNAGGAWIRPQGWSKAHARGHNAAKADQVIATTRIDDVLGHWFGSIHCKAAAAKVGNGASPKSFCSWQLPVLAAKFDVEGYQGRALGGALRLLGGSTRPDFMFLEVTPRVEKANGCDINIQLAYLHKLAYVRMDFMGYGEDGKTEEMITRKWHTGPLHKFKATVETVMKIDEFVDDWAQGDIVFGARGSPLTWLASFTEEHYNVLKSDHTKDVLVSFPKQILSMPHRAAGPWRPAPYEDREL